MCSGSKAYPPNKPTKSLPLKNPWLEDHCLFQMIPFERGMLMFGVVYAYAWSFGDSDFLDCPYWLFEQGSIHPIWNYLLQREDVGTFGRVESIHLGEHTSPPEYYEEIILLLIGNYGHYNPRFPWKPPGFMIKKKSCLTWITQNDEIW